jgi:DUF4097 and DUF4098 domain-containing protein YvlB
VESSPRGNWVIFGWLEHRVDIYLPASVWDSYEAKISSGSLSSPDISAGRITLECTSGEIDAPNLTATDDLSFTMSSGRMDVSRATGKRGLVEVTSGNFEADGLTVDDLTVDITSGDVNVENAQARTASAKAKSGFIGLEGTFYGVDVEITSGDVEIESDVLPETAELEASSGNIELSLPSGSAFTVEYDKTSGDIDSEFGHEFGGRGGKTGDSGPTYRVDITSGHIRFNR